MKAVIFGSNGQDGFYLSELLKKEGLELFLVSRKNSQIIGDISDFNFVSNLIERIKPDFLFNFAAESSISHEHIFSNNQTISLGTINILESVRLFSKKTKVFLCGSALQFKNSNEPIDENTEFLGNNPYSIFRINSTLIARYYRKNFGLNIYFGYLFNHDSPLRSESHINQKIISVTKRISKGSTEKLIIGNYNVIKEFSFAGDIVEAIWIFVNQDQIFEIVIGSGRGYKILDWIKLSFSSFNLNWEDHVGIDSKFKSEYEVLISKPTKLFNMNWMVRTSFEELFHLMLNSKSE